MLMRYLVAAILLVFVTPGFADSLWDHNGSTMRLEADGASRRMVYDVPRAKLKVDPGTTLFEGTRNGSRYEGMAYRFSEKCGPVEFPVEGTVSADERTIRLSGRAPSRDDQCNITRYFQDDLVFTLRRYTTDDTAVADDSGSDAPPDRAEIAQAVELLSASFTCPIPPNIRREIQNGEMLYYSTSVYTQRFTGDDRRLMFTFREAIKQNSAPGLGGEMDFAYDRSGTISYADIGKTRIEANLSEASEKWDEKPKTFRLVLSCRGGRECFTQTYDSSPSRSSSGELIFCDRDTAKNALLAIKVLITANR